GSLNPDFAPDFRTDALIRCLSRWCQAPHFGIKRIRSESSPPSRQGVSVAQRRRISALVINRFARNLLSRASGGSVVVSWLWPGRTDRLIIAPHDLRTADATRAAEI